VSGGALLFRHARPDDGAAVAPLMYESSRALLDYNFGFPGRDPRDFLRADFARGGGIFGWRHQHLATLADGSVVATITAYPGRLVGRLSRQTALSVLAHFGLVRTAVVARRSLHMSPLFITPQADAIFLANACVVPEERGRGIFAQLMMSALAAVRAPGLVRVELDVSFGNTGAQRLYQRLGFMVTGERPYRGPHALDGFRRMQRALD
jgi:ribosomal protein S18 acetylase RimI-like enzyme